MNPTPHRRRRRAAALTTLALAAGALLATGPTARAADVGLAADLVVAKDGSGTHTTVQAAVNAVPAGNPSAVTITVRPGTYRETVQIPSNKPHIRLVGSGSSPSQVTIVYNNSAGTTRPDGSTYGTSGSATFMADADDFQARNLTFANDFDEVAHANQSGHQAVALRTRADRIRLENVVVNGDQDTLLLDTAGRDTRGRVYITGSTIRGNVDFIFGRATAVITNSTIEVTRRPDGSSGGYVMAPSTAPQFNGFLITNSTITGGVTDRTYHLGRPWHAGGDAALDPQGIVRNTQLSAAVRTAPWTDMSGFSWRDDRFAEHRNTGPGSGPASADRPQLTDAQATAYTPAVWLGDWTP
ncbi:pectinesterase family protein [Streptomyces millisiae]|uniref:Pectinesterase family protein n=1 Tax=Streptomyces millisiae TaxID=3075542 RepID=A0ABU2LH42_9ACTN|nr:pectinesterase family protein [Streptomyces sp. DSM 44918]MDT0316901.1 pectinesterase family protein [Streptomyces sp. DSM 44918]